MANDYYTSGEAPFGGEPQQTTAPQDLLDSAIEQTVAQSANMQLLKMESETMMAEARIHPRDHARIVAELRAQFEAYPSLAEEAIYNKPVGRGPDKCTNCGAELKRNKGQMATRCFRCRSDKIEEGKEQFARGLSIRAAETLFQLFGYNRVMETIEPTDGGCKLATLYVDYEHGGMWGKEGFAGKTYKSKYGDTYTHSDDRFWGLVVKAEHSKLTREVILRCMPAGLKAEMEVLAERKIETLLTDATVTKIVTAFASKGVTEVQLEELLGRPRAHGWTVDQRKILAGVWNNVKDDPEEQARIFGLPGEKPGIEQPKPTREVPEDQQPNQSGAAATPDRPAEEPGPTGGTAVADSPAAPPETRKRSEAPRTPTWDGDKVAAGLDECHTIHAVRAFYEQAKAACPPEHHDWLTSAAIAREARIEAAERKLREAEDSKRAETPPPQQRQLETTPERSPAAKDGAVDRLLAALGSAKTITQVITIKREYTRLPEMEADRDWDKEVAVLCDERAEAIRAERGGRSNG